MSSALPSYEQAAAMVAAHAAQWDRSRATVERVALGAAAGRVLAKAICADRDQPPFARSTRDGFACRAADVSTRGFLPVVGSTRAGLAPSGPVPPGSAWEIMTGAPVPSSADAVVMIEHVEVVEGRIRLLPSRRISSGENIVPQGAQARQGDVLLPAGTAIT